MEIRDIRYFRAIARHKNLGRAAVALGLSQTALSKSLRRLEDSVSAKLVIRAPNGVELTSVGNALMAKVNRLELFLDDIKREATDLAKGDAGHVYVGIVLGYAETCMGNAYSALLKDSPNVSLTARVIASESLTPELLSGKIDFAVASYRPNRSPEIAYEQIYCDYRIICVAADHPLVRRKRVTLAELAKERWVSDVGAASWDSLCEHFAKGGQTPPKLLLQSNSSELNLIALASSNVVMHGSSIYMRNAMKRFRFAELQVEGMRVERRMGVIYRKDGYLSPVARRLMEILKEQGKRIQRTINPPGQRRI